MSNNDITDTIKEAVRVAQRKFAANPCDFLSSEKEVQFLLYSELRKRITESVDILRPEAVEREQRGAVPSIHKKSESRVKLEWPQPVEGSRVRHDIAVLRRDLSPKNWDSSRWNYKDLEAFIEVKSGWGPSQTILTAKTKGDFEKLNACKSKGYLVIFVGNEWKAMEVVKGGRGDQCFYREKLKEYKKSKTHSFHRGHVYVVFRVGILTGWRKEDFQPE